MTPGASIWESIRTSFWFVPAVLSAGAAALAIGLLVLDVSLDSSAVKGLAVVYLGGADGARSLLSTLAGSLATVIGVAFSVTIVSLQLASSQFGPRILRTFIRDRGNQAVLGTLVATFVYCLLVLRSVRGGDGVARGFVPHIAVTGGVLLGFVSVAMLIYFIHHLSVSIQADRVVAAVAHDLEHATTALYPEPLGAGERLEHAHVPAVPAAMQERAHEVTASTSGYLQMVDAERMLAIATEADLIVRVEQSPGDFVMPGTPLALVWPAERGSGPLDKRLRRAFVLGEERTLVQDLRFGVHQLTEIAVRALSTSLNDPFTALTCLDRLAAALAHVGTRRTPSPYRYDEGGRLRVIATPLTMDALVTTALDPIRRYGGGNPRILRKLLDVVILVGDRSPRQDLRAALLEQAHLVERAARETLSEPEARADIAERFLMAQRRLAAAPAGAREAA
ncbi:MAG TPA: DUF2254 domain-containing protein [Candidatus Tectomicrobia bacterium]|nr:DUF2254 domain-containing protein [Candidatus Tectomicrobia bacterium]